MRRKTHLIEGSELRVPPRIATIVIGFSQIVFGALIGILYFIYLGTYMPESIVSKVEKLMMGSSVFLMIPFPVLACILAKRFRRIRLVLLSFGITALLALGLLIYGMANFFG
jgi:hypothetical protein